MAIYMDILNYIFTNESSGLKIILMGHFLLTILGSLGSFVSNVYLFYNFPVLILLFWRILDRKTMEPLRMVMVLELCLPIIDVIYIGTQIGELNHHEHIFMGPLSLLMACGHLFVRPCVVYYLLKTSSVMEHKTIGNESNKNEAEIDEIYVDNNPFEPARKI